MKLNTLLSQKWFAHTLAVCIACVGVFFAMTAVADDGSDVDLCLAKSYPSMTLETLDQALDTLDDINAPLCRRKETVLFRASYGGSAEHVQLLINRGADPNIIVNDGCSAICRAAIWGNGEALDVLLKNGTKLFEPNAKLGRIFDRLIYYAPPDTAVSLADYVARSDHELDQNSWFFAISRYDAEVVKAFLKHRKPFDKRFLIANRNQDDPFRTSSFTWVIAALTSPDIETIDIFIKSYIDHNIDEFDDPIGFEYKLYSYFSRRDYKSYGSKITYDELAKIDQRIFVIHHLSDHYGMLVMPQMTKTGLKINYKDWQKFPFLKVSTPGDWESPVSMVDELSAYLKQARGGNNAPE